MPSNPEKAAFAHRLNSALAHGAPGVKGATQLSNHFNLRYQGNGVTPQTAHKWLNGRAIPTADKIEALASWLGVSARWLHHGPAPATPFEEQRNDAAGPGERAGHLPETWELAEKIRSLSLQRRAIVEQLVVEFSDGRGER